MLVAACGIHVGEWMFKTEWLFKMSGKIIITVRYKLSR